MDIILCLRRMGIILGINDQHLIPSGQHDVALHDRQHGTKAVIQCPRDLRGRCLNLRALPGIVFENKLLIQPVHALLVDERRQFVLTGIRCQKHPFQNQLAQADEHSVGIIVPLKTNGRPADGAWINGVNI